MDLINLLQTIKNETQPIEGHTDPKALDDCWNMVFEHVGFWMTCGIAVNKVMNIIENDMYKDGFEHSLNAWVLASRNMGIVSTPDNQ